MKLILIVAFFFLVVVKLVSSIAPLSFQSFNEINVFEMFVPNGHPKWPNLKSVRLFFSLDSINKRARIDHIARSNWKICGFFFDWKNGLADWLAHLFNWSRGFGAWRLIAQQISTNLEQQIAKLLEHYIWMLCFSIVANVSCFWNKVVSWPGRAHRWLNVLLVSRNARIPFIIIAGVSHVEFFSLFLSQFLFYFVFWTFGPTYCRLFLFFLFGLYYFLIKIMI